MYPKFKRGQRVKDISARDMQRISDGASKAETLHVRGPFLEHVTTRVAGEIRINLDALLNYVRPRVPIRQTVTTETHVSTVDITGTWSVVRQIIGNTIGNAILYATDPVASRFSRTHSVPIGGIDVVSVGGDKSTVVVMDKKGVENGFWLLDAKTLAPRSGVRRFVLPQRTGWTSIDYGGGIVLAATTVRVHLFDNGVETVFRPLSGATTITDIRGISGDNVNTWLLNASSGSSGRLYFMDTTTMKSIASVLIDRFSVRDVLIDGQALPSIEFIDAAGKGNKCNVLVRLHFPDVSVSGNSNHYYNLAYEIIDGRPTQTGITYLSGRIQFSGMGGGANG